MCDHLVFPSNYQLVLTKRKQPLIQTEVIPMYFPLSTAGPHQSCACLDAAQLLLTTPPREVEQERQVHHKRVRQPAIPRDYVEGEESCPPERILPDPASLEQSKREPLQVAA